MGGEPPGCRGSGPAKTGADRPCVSLFSGVRAIS